MQLVLALIGMNKLATNKVDNQNMENINDKENKCT
jgi:hypothetical protein